MACTMEAVMADNEGLRGVMLDNGVLFESSQEWLKLAVPKNTKPVKARKLKLVDPKGGVYAVPKSDLFAYAKTKLADGSVLTVMRYRTIPETERVTMHAQGVAAGLKMRDLEKRKDADSAPTSISID